MGHLRGNHGLHDQRIFVTANITDKDRVRVRQQLSNQITSARPPSIPVTAADGNAQTSDITLSAPEPTTAATDTLIAQLAETETIGIDQVIVDEAHRGVFSFVRRSGEVSIPITAQQIRSTLAAGRALLRRGQLPHNAIE
ncbi:hypothetical protein [Nocardia amamiensis]|uniref:hypothetical protein n=1 Tax=Nocardia amamiensis TaxID=404578 RepID=UPI0033F5C1BA